MKDHTHPDWDAFASRRNAGDVVSGNIVKIVPFGAFLDVDGAIGLIPQSTWDEEPGTGDTVTVRILAIDPDQRRFSAELV
jgi:ribosomal protein S1